MKIITTSRLTIEACTPWRIESAPSDGPTVRSSRYLIEAGSAPERKHQSQVVRFLLAELAFDHAGVVDAAVNDRSGLQPVFEHDAELLADILFGERTEPAARFGGKREIHIVEAGIFRAAHGGGAAQVAAGDDRDAVDQVPAFGGRLAGAGCGALSLHQSARSEAECRRARPWPPLRTEYGVCVHDQVQFQLPAGLNHALGAVGIAFAGELDDDFVVALAVGSDQRFGQTQRVNAAANGFFGLVHGLLLDVGRCATASW